MTKEENLNSELIELKCSTVNAIAVFSDVNLKQFSKLNKEARRNGRITG